MKSADRLADDLRAHHRKLSREHSIGPGRLTSFNPNSLEMVYEPAITGQSVVSPIKDLRVAVPFMTSAGKGEKGLGSWIRAAAFPGSGMLGVKGADNVVYTLGSIANVDWAKAASQAYAEGTGFWRTMVEGDVDIRTPANAGVYWSTRGILEMRGGLVRTVLDGLNGTSETRAASHLLSGPNQTVAAGKTDGVGDGIFFGVQRRYKQDSDRLPTPLAGKRGDWSKALAFGLRDADGELLYRHQVADFVADEKGDPKKGTDGEIRLLTEWFDDRDKQEPVFKTTLFRQKGNLEIKGKPSKWVKITFEPPTEVEWRVGNKLLLQGNEDWTAKFKSAAFTLPQGWQVNASSAKIAFNDEIVRSIEEVIGKGAVKVGA
jgi:hypothetical protein